MLVALSVLVVLMPTTARAADPTLSSTGASPVTAPTAAQAAHAMGVRAADNGAARPTDSSPMGGLAPQPIEHKTLSMGIAGGIFATLYGYTYLAWYKRAENSPTLQFHEEGWFGMDTYAGGADKVGHAWGNYAVTRGISGILQWGGWNQKTAIVTSSGMTMAFFLMSEIKDGYAKEYGFSWGDVVANLSGTALGVLLETSPTLDRMFDFRVEYWPSEPYRKSIATKGPFNASEDYTGQRFFLAYHLASIDPLRESKYFGWSEYLNVSLGFHAAHFKPEDTDSADHSQELFVGLSLDLQRVIEKTMMPSPGSSRPPSTGARALHFTTEIYQVPFTTLNVGGLSRSVPDPEPEVLKLP